MGRHPRNRTCAQALPLLLLLACPPAARARETAPAPHPGLRIEGNISIPASELLKALPSGATDQEGLRVAAETLEAHYRGLGYLEASVSTAPAAGGPPWTLSVLEGPLYRFGATRVLGLETLREEVVRRELRWRPGDPFRRRELFSAQSRIFGTGLFEDVGVRASTTAAKDAAVEVRVRERPMKWVKAGIGYGSDERERLSLVLTHHNLFGRAWRLDFTDSLSTIWVEHGAELVNRYFLGTRTEQRAQASWRREDRPGFDTERTLGRFSLGRELPWGVHTEASYRLERTVVFNLDPDIAATTPGESQTGAFGLSFSRDSSDDIFFPSRGGRAGLALERSGGFFGGNVHLLKASWDSARYVGLWGPLVGAAATRAGVVQETGPTPEVPVFARFFTGGASSVRGYRERGVGPTDSLGSPLGGSVLLGASAELRFPIFRRLSGAVFADGGQVGQKLNFAQPARWKYGSGGGLRVRTPVGPLRADIGYKINPDPGDNAPWRVHLSLGEAF